MKEIPTGSVDMVMADPPYGTTACKWDSVIDLGLMWEQLKRIIKPNGAIVMTASQPFTTTLIASNMKMFKYCWVWGKTRKTGFLNAKKRPLVSHEDIVVFYGKQCGYSPQMVKGKKHANGQNTKRNSCPTDVYSSFNKVLYTTDKYYPTSILNFNNVKPCDYVHPTQKPIALIEYLIKTYTNEGETVLDFCLGSGTTGVACKNLNRNFIGIELDSEYFKIAEKRINENYRDRKPEI